MPTSQWERELLTELKVTQREQTEILRQMNETHRAMCMNVTTLTTNQQLILKILYITVGVLAVIAAGKEILQFVKL